MRTKRNTVYIFSLLFLILLILKAETSMNGAKNALILCGTTVIPSLFPFFVLSSFMVSTGLVVSMGKIISPVARILFKTSGNGAVVFVMGILCGYPTGAKMIAELYTKGQLEKNEAQRLLPFCNNSGPLFIIGAVGIGMLKSHRLGILLYLVHILSALITGILSSFFAKRETIPKTKEFMFVDIGKAFQESVLNGTKTMINVCGYIVFFSVIREFFIPILNFALNEGKISLFLSGLAEVTIGAAQICKNGSSLNEIFVLTSGVLGFGGICVYLQVAGIVSEAGLKSGTYLLGKLTQTVISMMLSILILKMFDTQPAFLSIGEIRHRYLEASPYIFLSIVFAYIYARARQN